MSKTSLDNKGFGVIGVLIAVIVLAAIGAAGWMVYQHNHKAKSTASNTANTGSSTQTVKPDPYAGWKSYCDTAHKACFKYPASWTLSANTDQVTVLNPANNLEVDYIAPYVHDSGLLAFQPVSITDLASAGFNLKVVGGIYATANEPNYGVVNASLLTSNPLTVGQQTNFPNALRFTDSRSGSSGDIAFRARATDPFASQAEAHAWFNSADAATSLQILKSLQLQ